MQAGGSLGKGEGGGGGGGDGRGGGEGGDGRGVGCSVMYLSLADVPKEVKHNLMYYTVFTAQHLTGHCEKINK